MSKVTTFLTYVDQAEEAAKLYTSLFENARITNVTRYGAGAPMPEGSVLTVQFELDGRRFVAMNGGLHFAFSEAISLFVDCATQDEVDRYWDALSEGGEPGRCGWLKDRFGVSWQIVPSALPRLIGDPDPAKASRAMQVMLGMGKLDIAALERARDGR